MTTAFKVVRCSIEGLVSAVASDSMPSYSVLYTPNEWAVPRVGKLSVFNSVGAAKLFRSNYGYNLGYELWECETQNAHPGDRLMYFQYFEYTENQKKLIELFWSGDRISLYRDFWFHVPDGTLFCDAVKLTQKVC
jgi:hypothetical protein